MRRGERGSRERREIKYCEWSERTNVNRLCRSVLFVGFYSVGRLRVSLIGFYIPILRLSEILLNNFFCLFLFSEATKKTKDLPLLPLTSYNLSPAHYLNGRTGGAPPPLHISNIHLPSSFIYNSPQPKEQAPYLPPSRIAKNVDWGGGYLCKICRGRER